MMRVKWEAGGPPDAGAPPPDAGVPPPAGVDDGS
jgi:hypothetical protein